MFNIVCNQTENKDNLLFELKDRDFKYLPKSTRANLEKAFFESGVHGNVNGICLSSNRIIFKLANGAEEVFDRIADGSSVLVKNIHMFPSLRVAIAEINDVARREIPTAFKGEDWHTHDLLRVQEGAASTSPFIGFGLMAVVAGINSIFSDSLASAQSLGANAPVLAAIPFSSVVGGFLGGICGARSMFNGINSMIQAGRCGDRVGLADGFLSASMGASYVGMGAGMALTSQAIGGVSSAAISSLTQMTGYCNLAMEGLVLVNSALLHEEVQSFRKVFVNVLNKETSKDRDLASQIKNKAREGLVYLQQQISLTEAELTQIHVKFDSSKQEQEKTKRLQAKWNAFVRKVGIDCAQEVAKSGALLEKLNSNGSDSDESVKETIRLLELADKGSQRIAMTQRSVFFISMIGVVASLLLILFASSAAVPILFVISGLLSLLVDSNLFSIWINRKIPLEDPKEIRERRWPEIDPAVSSPIQTMASSLEIPENTLEPEAVESSYYPTFRTRSAWQKLTEGIF